MPVDPAPILLTPLVRSATGTLTLAALPMDATVALVLAPTAGTDGAVELSRDDPLAPSILTVWAGRQAPAAGLEEAQAVQLLSWLDTGEVPAAALRGLDADRFWRLMHHLQAGERHVAVRCWLERGPVTLRWRGAVGDTLLGCTPWLDIDWIRTVASPPR